MGFNPLVGVVDSAELSADLYSRYFSAAELQEAARIANPSRRIDWIAGRLAAKYVFLKGHSEVAADFCIRNISGDLLAEFDSRTYREVIITRDKSPGGGPARAGWLTESDTVSVAISHAGGFACAFIGAGRVYSVDLERSTARVPEFYKQNFTQRERSWTGDCSRSFQLDSDWLYTLLWSAKECLLKTPQFAAFSLWDMPSMEISFTEVSGRLNRIQQAQSWNGNFEFLQAEVAGFPKSADRPAAGSFCLAVSGTANLLLTAITRLDEKVI